MKILRWYICYCFDCGNEWGSKDGSPCPNCGSYYVDEKSDWNNATGCYGVSTITTPFDNESLLLAIGYYGGMENISTITIRTHYDIDWEEITGEIACEIHYQIAMEIPSATKFLVKYEED